MEVLSALALAVYLAAAVWLGVLERGGPPHAEVVLPDRIPATLHLPPSVATDARPFFDLRPREERPPAVVLMHGFAGDRLALSILARRLAHAGYAVLTFDARGHGENRTPFGRSEATGDTFHPELSAAVDFLRASPLVDGSRIVVGGHSMGAGASLDYGTRDSGIDGLVLISGGWRLEGPYRPPNTLFLYAAGDPALIRSHVDALAARIAGEPLAPGRTVGAFDRGTAIRVVEVPGADHASIVWTETAAAEIITWLDAVFDRDAAPRAVAAEPRLAAVLVLSLAFVLVLPGLGAVVGRIVPALPAPEGGAALTGLALIAAALAATMILMASGTPARILSVEAGDVIVANFALAGAVLLVGMHLAGRFEPSRAFAGLLPTAIGAALAVIAIFVLMNPIGVIFHRVTLTPERMLVFALSFLGCLPFSLAFQLRLRRGPPLAATLVSLAGRVLVLAMLLLGVRLGVLSLVVLLMLPALVIVFALFEVLAASLYAASRNLLAISLVDAAWLALIVAAIMPIRI